MASSKPRAQDSSPARRRTRPNTKEILSSKDKTEPENVRDMILRSLNESSRKYESRALADPFANSYGSSDEHAVEDPPYNPQALAALLDKSNILRQCVDAYVANIEATGHTLAYIGPEGAEESPASQQEKLRIESLLEQPNGDYDLLELRERNRRDFEIIGAMAMELIHNAQGGVDAYYNIPVHTLRLTKRDKEPTEIIELVNRSGVDVEIRRNKRFRRIVQEVAGKRVYFKEYGDPRSIDPDTGKEDASLAIEDQATVIIYSGCYRSGYSYGVPRYIHQLPSILGSREAELTNLEFFKDNAIPAMAVLISGGTATEQAIEDTEDYFRESRGRSSMNRILFIEAHGDDRAADEHGRIAPPSMQIKPLASERQNDAMFGKYDEANQKKTRSAFRLNPLFVGLSEDMTYATAAASLQMTEAQVFSPERNKVDQIFNLKILADGQGRPPAYWRMRSNPPRFVNPSDVIQSLSRFEAVGAMTPNIAIDIMNECFNKDTPKIEEPWGDLPFSVTKTLLTGNTIEGFEDLINPITPVRDDEDTEPTDDLDQDTVDDLDDEEPDTTDDEDEPVTEASREQLTRLPSREGTDRQDPPIAERVQDGTVGGASKIRNRTRT